MRSCFIFIEINIDNNRNGHCVPWHSCESKRRCQVKMFSSIPNLTRIYAPYSIVCI